MIKTKKEETPKKKPAAKVKKAVAVKASKPKAVKKPLAALKTAHRPAPKVKAVAAKVVVHKKKVTPPPVIPAAAPVIIEEKPKVAQKPIPVAVPKPKVEPSAPAPAAVAAVAPAPLFTGKELELTLPVTVKDLAVKLQEKPSNLIKLLMGMGFMVGINHGLNEEQAAGVCKKYGYQIKKALNEEEELIHKFEKPDKPEQLKPRPPIVTFMGHVDHGKTSLLDAIRKSKVTEDEHGGITQHIGAYRVSLEHGDIAFLDTPGHEAFTAMRARGAGVTDIVVLVVAADDGIMPQTREAIDHSKAAGVSIIVAVNKIDKPQADLDRVKKQLSELGLTAEDWGGKTITVPVSAKTGEGIDNLLEMILLEAQMLELKANPNREASGTVIEAKMSKGKGIVTTLLVKNGTLHLNDNIIAGNYYGRIKAMFNDHGNSVTQAGPSCPVEVLGISGIPEAGELFYAVKDEKLAKEMALNRQEKEKAKQLKVAKKISLEDLYAQIKEGKLKELKLIIKSDVQGSLEAIKDVLGKLNVTEINMQIIHEGVGNINNSDVILAAASNALILGFNVVVDDHTKELAEKEGVDVRIYNIIYELGNDIKAALEGMLEPKLKKVFSGRIEIRKVFKLSSRAGAVAGCFVLKGKIKRNASVSLIRNGEVIFEGKLSSLKRFKDDVRDVQEGFECGLTIGGFDDIREGDIVEAYDVEQIARKI